MLHQHKGTGPEPFRVMHPGSAAVGDAGGGCPPSGGNFSQRSHPFSHQFTILRGFHCQETTIHDQVMASAITNQHLLVLLHNGSFGSLIPAVTAEKV